jgi:hypothetical protein
MDAYVVMSCECVYVCAQFVKEENKESVHIVEPAIRTRLQRFFDVYNRQIPQIMGETSGGTPWPYDIV